MLHPIQRDRKGQENLPAHLPRCNHFQEERHRDIIRGHPRFLVSIAMGLPPDAWLTEDYSDHFSPAHFNAFCPLSAIPYCWSPSYPGRIAVWRHSGSVARGCPCRRRICSVSRFFYGVNDIRRRAPGRPDGQVPSYSPQVYPFLRISCRICRP